METPTTQATTTLFATPVQTPETMAAQVRTQLERRFADRLPPGLDLAEIARQSVAKFNNAKVKAFIPVLAIREAREIVEHRAMTPAHS
jgi:hypothetical protein